MQMVLEQEWTPELEQDLVLLGKDWPEQKLAQGQVNMLGPQLSSTLEHGKRWEPTIKGDQVSEMGIGLEQWPILESMLTLMGKPQLVPKRVVHELLRQQVPVQESHWLTELSLRPK